MEQLLTTSDAARALRRSVESVREYERTGRLPAIRTQSGVRLFKLSDVEQLAADLSKPKVQR